MAAVIVVPNHRPADRPHAARPDLRVIPGGRDRRSTHRNLPAAVYWRRRVLATLLLVVVIAVLGLATLGVRAITETPTVPGAPASSAPAAAAVVGESYVVRSGDTLWTIARRLQPTGDVRPLVDRLADRAGGAGLQPGQRIDIDGLVA